MAHLLLSLPVLIQLPRRNARNLADESPLNSHCRLSSVEIPRIDSPFRTSMRVVMPFVIMVVFDLAGELLAVDGDDQLGDGTIGVEILGQVFVLETKPR